MAGKDVVCEHGENLYPGWRCNYTQKGGGGATRLKQHLAGRGAEVVHCRNVRLLQECATKCAGVLFSVTLRGLGRQLVIGLERG